MMQLTRAEALARVERGESLAGVNLRGVELVGVSLRGVSFRGSDLSWGRFGESDFTGADFTGADLFQADFGGADLTHANFTGADLTKARTWWTNFPGLLVVEGLPSGNAMTWPTPDGWEVQVEWWWGTAGEMRSKLATGLWPDACGDAERVARGPELLEIADRFDAHAAAHHKTQEWLRDYWTQRAAISG